MGPSPTIPTSFVPKAPVGGSAHFTRTGGNIFLFFAMFLLLIAIIGAGGIFVYQHYLSSVIGQRQSTLSAAQSSVRTDAVENFIRFRDRFTSAQTIVTNHVQSSHLFDLLERITLVNVRFTNLSFERLDNGFAKLKLTGVARSFNALAAQSSTVSAEKMLKRAVFSGIQVSDKGTVGFTLTADIDSKLLAFEAKGLPVVPVATTTATTTATKATSTAPAGTSTAPVAPKAAPLPGASGRSFITP